MLIDLGDEVIFQVKIGEKTYDLKEPTESQIMALAENEEADENKGFEKLKAFMIELDMPEDVVKSLGVFRLKKFVTSLTKEMSEGK